jgi:hypothetical protein
MQSRCPLVRFSRVPSALLALALPSLAGAVQLDYMVEMGIEHNDNVNLSETDPASADILEPMLGFNLSENGSTVQALATGAVQYRDYLGGEFSDEFRGQLSSHLNWTVVPKRLNLTVEDYLTIQPVNPLEPDTPNNQQQTNVFAIGPTFGFRLGETMRGQAELRYVDSYADKTKEFNTNRGVGALRAIKDIDPTSSVSGNFEAEDINYTNDSATTPDYARYSLYGRYTRNWTKLDLTTDLGYSWLRFSGNVNEDRDDPLGRVTLDWRASPRSTLTGSATYQFSDAASGMMVPPSEIGNTIPSNIATGDATTTSQPYLERRFSFGYAWKGERFTFNVEPYYYQLDYVSGGASVAAGLNETGKGASAGFSYILRPLLTTGLTATGENLHYDSISRVDDSWTIVAFLRQQWTRNWSWRIELSHYDRNSNAPGLTSEENIAYFGIAYTR